MTSNNKQKPTPSVLRIEGEMTIYRAGELKQTLLDALDQAAVLEIDLSAVTEMDTAGLQVLMLARQVAQSKQQYLNLVAHSAPVLDVFELLNLAEHFGGPLNAASRPSISRAHAIDGALS